MLNNINKWQVSINYIIINFYIFLSLKSKLISLTEIKGQLLEDMKEESSIIALSNVWGNTYQDN